MALVAGVEVTVNDDDLFMELDSHDAGNQKHPRIAPTTNDTVSSTINTSHAMDRQLPDKNRYRPLTTPRPQDGEGTERGPNVNRYRLTCGDNETAYRAKSLQSMSER